MALSTPFTSFPIFLSVTLSLARGHGIVADGNCPLSGCFGGRSSATQIEDQEGHEVATTRLELLQRHQSSTNDKVRPTQVLKSDPEESSAEILKKGSALKEDATFSEDDPHETEEYHLSALGGFHRYLVIRPCERFAGDGMSGLPRLLVTGECCGDGICSRDKYEGYETCARDCEEDDALDNVDSLKVLPPTQSALFGELEGVEHDEYHCETSYDESENNECSYEPHRASKWLEDLKEREQNGTLPFDLPPSGSIALEIGAGRGQDSRNIATLAGYAVTAVDVSATAIGSAKNNTEPEQLGTGEGQVEFVAYDATALPVPEKIVDFFFDATVYCGLRHKYLSRLYGLWSRVLTAGHTLANIQCWNEESNNYMTVPRTKQDMETDFEPFFDILHSESCSKNQGGAGWCFYMKAKSPQVRSQLFEERLKLQQAARKGDVDFVRKNLAGRTENVSVGELNTLYYIAQANKKVSLVNFVASVLPAKKDSFFNVVYGIEGLEETVEAEDEVFSSEGENARLVAQYMKTDWERAESQLLLQNQIDLANAELDKLKQA